MGVYTEDAAGALADVMEAGTAVTFTAKTPGSNDPTTGTWTDAADTTVTGYAIRTRGDPHRYASLNLKQSESPTLLFTPSTYGEQPALGSVVTWDSVVYTVRDVEPVEPDGTAILCKVVVSR